MTFAWKLRIMRAYRKVTQGQLAALVGTAGYAILWIENGRLLPTPDIEARIKAALDWPENADEAFAILTGHNGNGNGEAQS